MTTTPTTDPTGAAVAAALEAVASTVRIGGGRGPRGAGAIVAQDRVVTNAHAVRGDEVRVRFADGTTATGTVAARDIDGDLAVVEVSTGDRPPVSWADEAPTVGQLVVTLVLTRQGPRVTTGRVSATGRRFRGPGGRAIDDGVEHTAPLARGASGSALLDEHGRVMGINTHRTDPFYLARPVTDQLRARVDALSAGEAPVRRRLGVAVAPPHVAARLRAAVGLEPRDGVLVRGVAEESPAAAAGIEAGDLLTAIDDTAVASPDDLARVLADGPDTVTATYVRGADEHTAEVTFPAAD